VVFPKLSEFRTRLGPAPGSSAAWAFSPSRRHDCRPPFTFDQCRDLRNSGAPDCDAAADPPPLRDLSVAAVSRADPRRAEPGRNPALHGAPLPIPVLALAVPALGGCFSLTAPTLILCAHCPAERRRPAIDPQPVPADRIHPADIATLHGHVARRRPRKDHLDAYVPPARRRCARGRLLLRSEPRADRVRRAGDPLDGAIVANAHPSIRAVADERSRSSSRPARR
jgi:hypothetical protein